MAVTEVAALVVRLEATTARFERQMKRADRITRRQMGSIERRVKRVDNRLVKFGERFGGRMILRMASAGVAVTALSKAIKSLVANGDKIKQLEGRFKALTGSAERSGKLIRAAFGIGAETGADFDAITSGLTRFTIAAEAIGATDDEVVQLTQNLLKLGTIGGGSVQEVRSGVIQLGQSIAKGRLDGDELRSVMENLPLVARAIADGFGVGVGQIKAMGEAGQLVADKVFKAILDRTEEIDAQFAQLPVTVERAANQMANSWIRLTAQMDKATGASTFFSKAIQSLANAFEAQALEIEGGILNEIAELEQQFFDLRTEIAKLPNSVVASGWAEILEKQIIGVKSRIAELKIQLSGIVPLLQGGLGSPLETSSTATRPIPPPRRPRGLGVFNLRDEDPFTVERRVKVETQAAQMLDQMRERVQLLGQQQQLVGKSTVAQAALNAQFQKERILMEFANLAKDKSVTVTPEQIAQAEALAEQFENEAIALAVLNDVLDKNEEAQRDAARAAEENKRRIEEVGDAIAGAIIQADSFKDALRNVAIALLNIGIKTAGRILTNKFVPSAKGNAFSGGKVMPFARGGVVDSPTVFPMAKGVGLMGEAGPEAILPLKRGPGGVLGVSGGGGGGPPIVVNIENNFALGVAEEMRAQINAATPRIINAAKAGVADAVVRGGRFSRAFG